VNEKIHDMILKMILLDVSVSPSIYF